MRGSSLTAGVKGIEPRRYPTRKKKGTYQFLLDLFDHSDGFLHIRSLASHLYAIRIVHDVGHIDSRVGLVTDFFNGCSALANYVLVEIFEDLDFGLVVVHNL